MKRIKLFCDGIESQIKSLVELKKSIERVSIHTASRGRVVAFARQLVVWVDSINYACAPLCCMLPAHPLVFLIRQNNVALTQTRAKVPST